MKPGAALDSPLRPELPATGDVRCPRCGGCFHCGMNDIRDAAPCACTTLKLDDALLAALRQRWQGCLCLDCLSALAAGSPIDSPRSA